VVRRLARALPRARLIAFASLFCISNMVVFWALQPGVFFEQLPVSGIVFYLWVGMFGVFVVAQFWAFAADVYEDGPGRRILPMIAIGPPRGRRRLGMSISSAGIGRPSTCSAARPLGLSILLTRTVDARGATEPAAAAPAAGRIARRPRSSWCSEIASSPRSPGSPCC
jgi:AAA family ATP:ADP antiporter